MSWRCAMSASARARDLVAQLGRSRAAAIAVGALDRLVGDRADVVAVLTYHRIDEVDSRPWLEPSLRSATPEAFEEQVAAIAREYQPIGIRDLLESHRRRRRLPARSILFTFDDGYADIAEHAWPVLRSAGIPATLFVPTAYPGQGAGFWWDRLRASLAALAPGPVETPFGVLALHHQAAVSETAARLRTEIKGLPHEEAMRIVDVLWERAGRPTAPPGVATWSQLRAMADEGLTLAPHSHDHPLLTRVPYDVAVEEVRRSREVLAREVPTAVTEVFAYPSGAWNAEAARAALEAGIELAFTTERGVNRMGRSPALALRRINVGSRAGPSLVRAQITVARLLAGRSSSSRSGQDTPGGVL
jgi:peptidoglycan/xylan/chitin deacetylase (PgdA/CDA1 family)